MVEWKENGNLKYTGLILAGLTGLILIATYAPCVDYPGFKQTLYNRLAFGYALIYALFLGLDYVNRPTDE